MVAFDFKMEDELAMVISAQGYKFVRREGAAAGRASTEELNGNFPSQALPTESS
jgi:hypothetical protein